MEADFRNRLFYQAVASLRCDEAALSARLDMQESGLSEASRGAQQQSIDTDTWGAQLREQCNALGGAQVRALHTLATIDRHGNAVVDIET